MARRAGLPPSCGGVKQLQKVDQEEEFLKSSPNRSEVQADREKKTRRLADQRSAVTNALRSLTKQTFVTLADWWNWWQKNKAAFKVQD